jgi:hypothetical protein
VQVHPVEEEQAEIEVRSRVKISKKNIVYGY